MQKMQIVEIDEKDLIDTIMLLLEYPFGDGDDGRSTSPRSCICARDWGWWRTLTMNLDKVRQMAATYPQLTDEQNVARFGPGGVALDRIEAAPKSMGWKLRSGWAIARSGIRTSASWRHRSRRADATLQEARHADRSSD